MPLIDKFELSFNLKLTATPSSILPPQIVLKNNVQLVVVVTVQNLTGTFPA